MRLLLHDYSGHPFQAELARYLADRGHDVTHVSCSSYVSGKGDLESASRGLRYVSISLTAEMQKYRLRRVTQEISYARRFLAVVRDVGPDVVVMCNVPLLAHWLAAIALRRREVRCVFWHQDLYSRAVAAQAIRMFGKAGRLVGWLANLLERDIARASDSIVVIGESFLPVHREWGTADRVTVQPNWAPLAEVQPRPRDNTWSRQHFAGAGPRLIYAGTLGLKHNPELLAQLHKELRVHIPNLQTIVISAGPGARQLELARLSGLRVLPYQSFADLPDVLASADALVAILEPAASIYSIPSKILTYLAAGRFVVAIMQKDGEGSRIVSLAGGFVIEPSLQQIAGTAPVLVDLLRDEEALLRRGAAARNYAEEEFDIATIGRRFEMLLLEVNGAARGRGGALHLRWRQRWNRSRSASLFK